jgi:predicted HicB family RNase H-like nuclease
MSIEVSDETEARIANEARRQGISVDALLEQLMNERAALSLPAQARLAGLASW